VYGYSIVIVCTGSKFVKEFLLYDAIPHFSFGFEFRFRVVYFINGLCLFTTGLFPPTFNGLREIRASTEPSRE
jgi:hypothetical protein